MSSDRDEDSFKEYFAEQPWLALDYSCRKEKGALSQHFAVEGIPSFVIVDKDGSTITKGGKSAVSADPEGHEFPWHPKPVPDLPMAGGAINETAMVLMLCEASSEEATKAVAAAAEPLAKKFLADAKAKGEDTPEIVFAVAKVSDGMTSRIREMTGLPGLPPAAHEHPLELKDAGSGWGCDGCGKGGGPDVTRFRCTQGCDFDFCEDCNNKVGTRVAMPPKLILLNIPDNGGYYVGADGDITAATIEAFVSDFQAGKLERKQLG